MIKLKDGRYRERVGNKYFYGHTKSEVTKKIAAWSVEQQKGLKFSQTIDMWDDYRRELVERGKLEYNTYSSNKSSVARLREQFGDYYIRKITPAMVDAYIQSVDGAKRTVQMRLDVLNMVFRFGIVKGHLDVNPCDAVGLPKGLVSKKRTLPSDDVIAKVKAGRDIKFGLFAYFMLYSGLRRGELLALRWSDIDFDLEQIHVQRAMYWEVNQPRLKEPKTDAGKRIVPLLIPLVECLNPPKRDGYIFASDDGGMMTQTVFRRRWNMYCREAGIAKATVTSHVGKNGQLYRRVRYTNDLEPHQLRHAFATILFEADVSEQDAMDILGHSSIKVTKDIYTHIKNSRRCMTAKKLNQHIARTGKLTA